MTWNGETSTRFVSICYLAFARVNKIKCSRPMKRNNSFCGPDISLLLTLIMTLCSFVNIKPLAGVITFAKCLNRRYQDYAKKTTEPIFIKFGGKVARGVPLHCTLSNSGSFATVCTMRQCKHTAHSRINQLLQLNSADRIRITVGLR